MAELNHRNQITMRNPKWHRDEIILALDLYFSRERGSIDGKNPKVVELSKILNELPIFPERPDKEKFRNSNGVTLKLSNFLAIDPDYKGKGMKSDSKLDREVFTEFYGAREKLRAIASKIKDVSGDLEMKKRIYEIEEDEQTKTDSVMEGSILYKLHKVRERDASTVKLKKDQVFSTFGKIACEACIFDFEEYYGPIGKGFIECHHRSPLSGLKVVTQTNLSDLALVCSNCHRMLHRRIGTLSVEELKAMIKYDRLHF